MLHIVRSLAMTPYIYIQKPILQTTLYTEDWIGLKTLDEAGKVKFVNVSGSHLEVSYGEMKDYILPYLLENSIALPRLSKSSHASAWSSHDGKKLKLYASD